MEDKYSQDDRANICVFSSSTIILDYGSFLTNLSAPGRCQCGSISTDDGDDLANSIVLESDIYPNMSDTLCQDVIQEVLLIYTLSYDPCAWLRYAMDLKV